MRKPLTLLLLLILSFSNLTAQEKKVLDAELNSRTYYTETTSNYLSYEKLGEGFIRIEDNKVERFDKNYDKVWSVEVEKPKGYQGIFTRNLGVDGDDVYISYNNIAMSQKDIEAVLTKINAQGETKSIQLNEINELRTVSKILFSDDHVFVATVKTTGVATPFGNNIKNQVQIFKLDKDLNFVDKVELPNTYKETEFSTYWVFNDQKDNMFHFYTNYYKDGQGQPTHNKEKENQFYTYTLKYNTDLELISEEEKKINPYKTFYEGKKLPDTLSYGFKDRYIFDIGLKYDTSQYKVYLHDNLLTRIRNFETNNTFTNIEVEINGKRSDNLYNGYWEFVNPKRKDHKKGHILFYDAIEDPFNNSLQIFLSNGFDKKYYFLTLDKELNIAHIAKVTATKMTNYVRNYENNFSFGYISVDETYGHKPKDHKQTALDLALTFENDAYSTILTYENKQLLIRDEKKSKKVVVYELK